MRGCAPAAIALVALEACAPSGSAKRSASYLADLPDLYTACSTTRTPEAYENCRAAISEPASLYDCGSADCAQGLRNSVRAGCGDSHSGAFQNYLDCVAIGENQLGPNWWQSDDW
jgi:hypothetical protein